MESALSASRRIDGYGGGEGGLGGGGDDDVHADAAYGDMICNNKDWWLCRSLGRLGEKRRDRREQERTEMVFQPSSNSSCFHY